MHSDRPPIFPKRFWLYCLLVCLTAFLIGFFCGCDHLTIAPKRVEARTVAFSGNEQNAGILDCDKDGCIVDAGWLAKYKALEAKFDVTFAFDKDIKPEGNNYRITYEIFNSFAELRAAERGP